MSELLDLATYALGRATTTGADACDVSVAEGRALDVEIQESAVVSCDRHEGVTVCVRAFVRGGCGVHVCHGVEPGVLVHAAEAAVSAARAAGPDPDWRSLSRPRPAATVPGLYDETLEEVSAAEASAMAREVLERALLVDGGVNVSGALSFVVSSGALASSAGVVSEERATSVSCDLFCVLRRDGLTGSFADFDIGRRREDVDLGGAGERAAKGALRYLGPRPMRGGEMPLVTGPLATNALMESLAHAASAEPIQRGRSYLRDRMNGRVGPSFFTLEDDGLYPAGLHSSSRDGEGTPRRRIAIVEKGVFRNQLHDSYTAGKAAASSTGHGDQLGGISPTNLRPRVGTRRALSLIGEVDDGLYVEQAMLSPNPVTGEFSTTVDWAMKIENGGLAHPVTGLAISGGVLELMSDLEEVSSDCREEPGIVMPTMRFSRVSVAGS